jgi:hypothetical protein
MKYIALATVLALLATASAAPSGNFTPSNQSALKFCQAIMALTI